MSNLLNRAVKDSVHDEVLRVHNSTVETIEGQERLKQRFIVNEASHPDTEGAINDSLLIKAFLFVFLDGKHCADDLEQLVGEVDKVYVLK